MSNFDWPWEYSFPPFFTLQKHTETREKQIAIWKNLILNYQKYINQTVLNINEDTPLFNNEEIKRKLPVEARLILMEHLQNSENSIPLDKKKFQWEIYWHTLNELSNLIYDWIIETGQTSTVCTLYEISNGELSVGKEFQHLQENVLLKALKILENKGKCEVIDFDDNRGVKFF